MIIMTGDGLGCWNHESIIGSTGTGGQITFHRSGGHGRTAYRRISRITTQIVICCECVLTMLRRNQEPLALAAHGYHTWAVTAAICRCKMIGWKRAGAIAEKWHTTHSTLSGTLWRMAVARRAYSVSSCSVSMICMRGNVFFTTSVAPFLGAGSFCKSFVGDCVHIPFGSDQRARPRVSRLGRCQLIASLLTSPIWTSHYDLLECWVKEGT